MLLSSMPEFIDGKFLIVHDKHLFVACIYKNVAGDGAFKKIHIKSNYLSTQNFVKNNKNFINIFVVGKSC